MASPRFTHPARRLRRALPRFLWVAVPLAAFGCDGATEPVGPSVEAESLATPSLVTGDRIAFILWQRPPAPLLTGRRSRRTARI